MVNELRKIFLDYDIDEARQNEVLKFLDYEMKRGRLAAITFNECDQKTRFTRQKIYEVLKPIIDIKPEYDDDGQDESGHYDGWEQLEKAEREKNSEAIELAISGISGIVKVFTICHFSDLEQAVINSDTPAAKLIKYRDAKIERWREYTDVVAKETETETLKKVANKIEIDTKLAALNLTNNAATSPAVMATPTQPTTSISTIKLFDACLAFCRLEGGGEEESNQRANALKKLYQKKTNTHKISPLGKIDKRKTYVYNPIDLAKSLCVFRPNVVDCHQLETEIRKLSKPHSLINIKQ